MTNHVPRRHLTRWVAWFTRLEHPWIRRASIAVWRFFCDVDLRDARTQSFKSLHACFVRELRAGARPIDPTPQGIVSPCDAIVGATGKVAAGLVLQAKGRSYPLAELLCDAALARLYEGGGYATLRLTAGMYHRFHAPDDCTVEQVTFVPGDLWNVNAPSLARIDRLYCRNERAVIRCRTQAARPLTLVPVGAILVGSIRLHCLPDALNQAYRGPHTLPCAARYAKGAELGWFEHGSTIIVLVPAGLEPVISLRSDSVVRVGQLLYRPH